MSTATQFHTKLSLLVDPNNGCNLNCIHCGLACAHLEHFSKQEIMSVQKFDQMIEILGPYIKSLSIGCIREPLVHPNIDVILKHADQVLKTIPLKLTTNGILLSEPLIAMFAKAYHDWSFNISIESADPDTYEKIRRGAKFEIFDRNIKYLCALKAKRPNLKIYFSTVVMKANLHCLEEVLDYAQAVGVDGVTLMDLEPHVHNEHLVLSPEEKKEWSKKFARFQEQNQDGRMTIGKHDGPSQTTDSQAVMNQKGDIYPSGFRQPIGNVFEISGLKMILEHYQKTPGLEFEKKG